MSKPLHRHLPDLLGPAGVDAGLTVSGLFWSASAGKLIDLGAGPPRRC